MSEIFHDLVVPYLGPGFCCALSCQYFHYESFHKPIQGCKGFENFKEIESNKMIVDPKFSLHKFMDFAANQKWKCFNKKCPISWSEPFHCQGDSRCISFSSFCEYFNITFTSDAKSENKISHEIRDTIIHSHKAEPNEFDPDCPDLPDLANDSGLESDSDTDDDIYEKSKPKKIAKSQISESKVIASCPEISPCCPCGLRGTCAKTCPCRKGKTKCFHCLPSIKGRCSNIPQFNMLNENTK